MKTNIIKTAAAILCISGYSHSCISAQNVGINATGATPNTSAMLDVASTTSGMLLPRMNTTERDAIASPANGLYIYNTDCNRFNWYDGSAWKAVGAVGDAVPGAAGTISGTATVCQGQTGVAYTISAVSGASGYVWTYTGTGFSIASGANTNAITADFSAGATAGNLTVYATHACESGTPSPVYSININVLAPAPVATAATNLAGSSFDANWDASAGATTYYLDVSTASDFSSFVAGYNDLDAGAVVTYGVVGLTCNTTYYYRVRAGNTCGSSTSSNTITAVTTSACWTCGDNITFTYRGVQVTYGTVTGQNGTCWLDRNLGASQVATSSTDAASYGDLFQWGRLDDEHQDRTSATTAVLSGSDTPGHGNFITNGSSPYDWRSPQNDNLWQGVSGTNNPCPTGYRLPTEAELNAERVSWGSNDAAGAFGSPLKLPVAGARSRSDGSLISSRGYYWSSTVSGTISRFLYFFSGSASMTTSDRADGFSCRCVKD